MPATKNAAKKSPAKSAAKKSAAKPVVSSWVTQSKVVPDAGMAVSKFTTQAQRRLLRALVAGETPGDAPATRRSLARLEELGLVSVAKNGTAKVTKSGREFVSASPAPRVRETKPAKVPAKKGAAKGAAKSAVKVVSRKVTRKGAKSSPANSGATPAERKRARQAAAVAK